MNVLGRFRKYLHQHRLVDAVSCHSKGLKRDSCNHRDNAVQAAVPDYCASSNHACNRAHAQCSVQSMELLEGGL